MIKLAGHVASTGGSKVFNGLFMHDSLVARGSPDRRIVQDKIDLTDVHVQLLFEFTALSVDVASTENLRFTLRTASKGVTCLTGHTAGCVSFFGRCHEEMASPFPPAAVQGASDVLPLRHRRWFPNCPSSGSHRRTSRS